MTIDDQVLRLIVARLLMDRISEADRDTRAEVKMTWMVGDRIGAVLAGQPAGHAQVKKPSQSARVSDSQAFEAWVAENRPEEIETVTTTRVRPAFQAAVLGVAKKHGVAVTPDGEEIPGIAVATGEPTVAVTLADNAADLLAAAWEIGELWAIVGALLPQLEAGEPGD